MTSVADLDAFSTEWVERRMMLRGCIITCRDSMQALDDLPPIVRIVPSSSTSSDNLSGLRVRERLISFGLPITEGDGRLEALYEQIFTLEAALLSALPTSGSWLARWVETVTDEDRATAYKLMALRVEVVG